MKKLFIILVSLLVTVSVYSQKKYKINTHYAELGGFVIKVNEDGTHGVVVAMTDQGFASTLSNVKDLINIPSNHTSDGSKFNDWRLPNKDELNMMYAQKRNIGGLPTANDISDLVGQANVKYEGDKFVFYWMQRSYCNGKTSKKMINFWDSLQNNFYCLSVDGISEDAVGPWIRAVRNF